MTESKMGRTLDCGDNSCAFAINRGGMRTNGGCRCLKRLTIHVEDASGWVIPRSRFNVIETHVREYRAAVKKLAEAGEHLRDVMEFQPPAAMSSLAVVDMRRTAVLKWNDALAALARLESGEGE